MGMIKTITKKDCIRCGHTWYPRSQNKPIICPKCKSPYWNKAKKEAIKEAIKEVDEDEVQALH